MKPKKKVNINYKSNPELDALLLLLIEEKHFQFLREGSLICKAFKLDDKQTKATLNRMTYMDFTMTDRMLYLIDLSRLENRSLTESEYEEIVLLLKGDPDYSDLADFSYEELKSGSQKD